MKRLMTRRIFAVTALGIAVATGISVNATPASATFPGDDGRIVFYVDRGSGPELDTVRPDGSGLRVVFGPAEAVGAADWSPDGTRLVFAVHTGTCEETCAIAMIKRDGTGFHIVYDPPGGDHGAINPKFLPGGRIVFTTDCVTCHQSIWTMNRRGGDRRRILDVHALASDLGLGDFYVQALAVSPHGRHIGFVATQGSELRKGIFAVRRDGTHFESIVPFWQDAGLRFDWAPDGRHVVYTRYSDAPDGHSPNAVRIRADGSHARLLTHVTEPGVSVGVGTYSPSGHWIVYRHQNDNTGVSWLMKMHPNGSNKTRVLRGAAPAGPGGIVWGPRPA